MNCPFCKQSINDGAIKCHYCQEFIFETKQDKVSKQGKNKSEIALEYIKTLSWPSIVIFTLLVFQNDLTDLIKRAKSIEVPGVKTEFVDYTAALGYLENKVNDIVQEKDPQKRVELQKEVNNTVIALQGLHPKSLSILIEIGRGVIRDDYWENNEFVFLLYKRGYVNLIPAAISVRNIKKSTVASLTEKGSEFLNRIGFADHK